MGKREVTRSREELDLAVPQVSLERRAVDTERVPSSRPFSREVKGACVTWGSPNLPWQHLTLDSRPERHCASQAQAASGSKDSKAFKFTTQKFLFLKAWRLPNSLVAAPEGRAGGGGEEGWHSSPQHSNYTHPDILATRTPTF